MFDVQAALFLYQSLLQALSGSSAPLFILCKLAFPRVPFCLYDQKGSSMCILT